MGISTLQTAYSFANVTATLNKREVVGFWEGDDAVTVEENADIGTGVIGADGASIFSQAVNRGARITLRVMPNSPIHSQLNRLLQSQRDGNLGGFGFTVTDTASNEGGSCDRALIVQAPGTQNGTAAAVRTWVLWTGYWVWRIPQEY